MSRDKLPAKCLSCDAEMKDNLRAVMEMVVYQPAEFLEGEIVIFPADFPPVEYWDLLRVECATCGFILDMGEKWRAAE